MNEENIKLTEIIEDVQKGSFGLENHTEGDGNSNDSDSENSSESAD